jgi:hypothetical protein
MAIFVSRIRQDGFNNAHLEDAKPCDQQNRRHRASSHVAHGRRNYTRLQLEANHLNGANRWNRNFDDGIIRIVRVS